MVFANFRTSARLRREIAKMADVLELVASTVESPVFENYSEADNCSNNATSHSSHGHSSPGTVLFLFAAFAVGGT